MAEETVGETTMAEETTTAEETKEKPSPSS